jgi:hypothetical protein
MWCVCWPSGQRRAMACRITRYLPECTHGGQRVSSAHTYYVEWRTGVRSLGSFTERQPPCVLSLRLASIVAKRQKHRWLPWQHTATQRWLHMFGCGSCACSLLTFVHHHRILFLSLVTRSRPSFRMFWCVCAHSLMKFWRILTGHWESLPCSFFSTVRFARFCSARWAGEHTPCIPYDLCNPNGTLHTHTHTTHTHTHTRTHTRTHARTH